MIVCEKCGGESFTVESRAIGNTMRRRRACKKCNWRWRTVEVCIDALSDLAKAVRFIGEEKKRGRPNS